jgi:hypothetical protein
MLSSCFISYKAWGKIQAFNKAYPNVEWGGICFVKEREDSFLVEDIFATNFQALYTIDLDTAHLGLGAHIIKHNLYEYHQGYIHSHHTMPTNPSPEDLRSLVGRGKLLNVAFSLIVNNAMNNTMLYYINGKGFRMPVELDNIGIVLEDTNKKVSIKGYQGDLLVQYPGIPYTLNKPNEIKSGDERNGMTKSLSKEWAKVIRKEFPKAYLEKPHEGLPGYDTWILGGDMCLSLAYDIDAEGIHIYYETFFEQFETSCELNNLEETIKRIKNELSKKPKSPMV